MLASVFGLPSSAIAGLPEGSGYALLALGLLLLYRMAGVVSFTQSGFGVFGAILCANLQTKGVPFGLALVLGLLVGAAVGGAFGFVMARWFAERSVMIRSAVTIAASVCLATAAERIFGSGSPYFRPIVPSPNFRIGSTFLPANTIFAVLLAALLAFLFWFVLKTTRLGLWLRAMSDRAVTTQLLGVRVTSLTVGVWAFSGMLAVMALFIIGNGNSTDPGDLAVVSVESFAAALVCGFSRFGVAVIGGVLIGVFESMALATPSLAAYSQLVPLVVIVLVLLWSKRGEVWGEAR